MDPLQVAVNTLDDESLSVKDGCDIQGALLYSCYSEYLLFNAGFFFLMQKKRLFVRRTGCSLKAKSLNN